MLSRTLLLKHGGRGMWMIRSMSSNNTPTTTTDKTTLPAPTPGTSKPDQLHFDQTTHTGQAWDNEDYRLQRFDIAPKQVNPNIAMHLIAEQPPKACEDRVVFCDGHPNPALGHPRVYINLDKPGNHACGYCGLRFYNVHVHHDGSEHIQV